MIEELIRKEVEPIANILATRVGDQLAGKGLVLSGAQGLLGRYTVEILRLVNRVLAARGADTLQVLAMDVATPTAPNTDNIRFIKADVRGILPAIDRCDFVLHLAGLASPVVYKREPLLTIEVAVDGSLTMLELARRTGSRYLFTSTSEIYQTPPADAVPTPETYVGQLPTTSDRSCYDVSKAMGETLAYVYQQKFGVHSVIVRLFNSFGIGLAEADQRITARLASAVKSGMPLTVYGYDERSLPTRTYCPAADTVYGMLLALLLGRPAEIYNIGASGPEITVPELCRLVSKIVGKPVPYRLVPPPDVYKTEPQRRCPDIRKAERELGYTIEVPLEDGIRSFMEWSHEVYRG